MTDQPDLFTEAKIKIAEKKKSYLSKLISKKQKFEYNLQKKRPNFILKYRLAFHNFTKSGKPQKTGSGPASEAFQVNT